jgi:AsmA protein
MRIDRKWAVAGLVALTVTFGAGLGAYPWDIDPTRIAAELNAATTPVNGLHWGRPERATFTALPWPTLRVIAIDLFDAANKRVLAAPSADFRLWPLGFPPQTFAPISATLFSPTATIDLDAARRGAEEITDRRTAPLIRIAVQSGVARIMSAELGVDSMVANVDGWLQWTKPSRPLGFSLSGVWRGQPVAIEGGIESLLRLRAGGASPFQLRVTTPLAELALAGTWTGGDKAAFDGTLTSHTPSPGALGRWLGLPALARLGAEDVGLQGKFNAAAGLFALGETRLEIGRQRLEGSIGLARTRGRVSIAGTLAADSLDLSGLWGSGQSIVDSAGGWSHATLLATPSDAPNLDLRLSAARLSWLGHRIDDAAISVRRADGRLTFTLLQATARDGQLSGELSIETSSLGPKTEVSASLVDADVGALLGEWGLTTFSGRGDLKGNVSFVGASPAEIAASMKGSAGVDLKAGAIEGIDFEQALRKSLRRPLDFSRDVALGETKFSEARARLEIADGEARIVDARMEGPGAIVELQGAIGLAARQWRARIEAVQANALGSASLDAARLTISLLGPWAAPTFAALASTE